jgi:phage shock protein PspC (stress-responsive transcriptional regulator)
MKKIININLSGRVIPIEDSAYENLQSYIESLRRYFANEDGREEIINDIESRIAELMNEKVAKGSSAITDADVDQIASSMGRPEDFAAEALDSSDPVAPGPQVHTTEEKRTRRRLYRDTSDKFIAGVCSGIAAYLNVDPAIVRILFAIISFGGFGLGFLAYIILWIVLPTKDLEGFSGKRLYRNPDDKIIGGVAGGLGAYFNIRTSTVRLIFAIPLILNVLFGIMNGILFEFQRDFFYVPNIVFGSFTGTFILGYIILWMVLPEARSTYEKMEMRGEKVDVNTIRQNVKEGMDTMKDRVKQWGGEVKESAQKFSTKASEFANTRGRQFAREAGEAARRTGGGLGHAIGVLFKVFFLFIAGTIAFALFVALIALVFSGAAWWPVNNFLWTSGAQQAYAWGTLIFFFMVPLIAFITWVVRRILRVRSRSNYLGWTFAGLWTIGWISAALLAASISKDLREYEHSDTAVTISQPANNRMIVNVSEPKLEYTGSFGWVDNDASGWDLSEDTLKLSFIRFDIQKSEDSLYHVTLKKYSAGRNRQDALERADKIIFHTSYKDSILDLGSGYAISSENKLRGQKIIVEIRVPAGKKINFHESVNKLNPTDIMVRRHGSYSRKGRVNIDFDENYSFPWSSNVDYTMGEDGELKDGTGKTIRDDYRYDPPADTLISIEEQRKKAEQENEKLRQMEKQDQIKQDSQRNNRSNPGTKKPAVSIKDEVAMGSPYSIFSGVETWN